MVAANPTVPSPILLTAVQMLLPWNVSPRLIPPVLIATVETPTAAFCVRALVLTLIILSAPIAVSVVISDQDPEET